MYTFRWLCAIALVLIVGLAQATDAPKANPFIIIGVDGMEWSVIDSLSAKGQLPNLKAFRARAATAKLATDYGAASPVVWTTVATGMNKEVHGITNFEVNTDAGTAPVSSTMRKVPAIWNMVTLFNRKVMLLGWWGSWPAEKVNGIIVSDRAAKKVDNRVSPPEFESTFASLLPQINADRSIFPNDEDAGAEDRMVSWFLNDNAAAGYDLLIGYLHGPDLVSHKYWKYYQPESFTDVDPTMLAKYQDAIPGKYRAVDTVLGKVLAKAPKNANILVISDHGFGPLEEEFVKVNLEFDNMLVELGFVKKSGTSVDFASTKVYNYETAGFQMNKMVRYALAGREKGGTVTEADKAAIRADLTAKLAQVTYETGKPVFAVRDAKPFEAKKGADFVVDVLTTGATANVRYQGRTVPGVIKTIVEHSGGHSWLPPGVFMAAGPDIDTKAQLDGIRIHDITPTVLYGMNLPIAEDFAGKSWTNLYTSSFQAAHPVQRIPSYGQLGAGQATTSTTDQEMLEQLRSLGYIQ